MSHFEILFSYYKNGKINHSAIKITAKDMTKAVKKAKKESNKRYGMKIIEILISPQ